MGCDIHAFVERKTPRGGWQHIDGAFGDIRCYGIFAFLTGGEV